ncbi:uncharacterized protein LOC133800347 [Humulus lupulus]|uniref:uncharacterized protein LOC133800347 n=1 Tax=Humulus lupulus TaxID=3486 RepID=UPI002B40993C|nr:uncharacterized protein LOC133800347 [Humulus lupulus]
MDTIHNLTQQYSNIQLEEEEEEIGLVYGNALATETTLDDRFCLVGKFLTTRSIDFDAMQHMIASLWQPGRGMFAKELDSNRYLFQFYHELDIQRVIDRSPWMFNNSLLVMARLKQGEDPKLVPLNRIDIWVQLHDLRPGFFSQRVVKDAGNVIGTFMESDPKNFDGMWRSYLRVRVSIVVDKPLQRRMKMRMEGGELFWVNFKYEHIPTFCFICGLLGHSERFCPKLFDIPAEQEVKPYGAWMRALPRRRNHQIDTKWLRPFMGGSAPREGGFEGSPEVGQTEIIDPLSSAAIVGGKSGIAILSSSNLGKNGQERSYGEDNSP